MLQVDPTSQARFERLCAFLQEDPANSSLLTDTFDAALSVGAQEVATRITERALQLWPGDVEWQNREGILLLAKGESALAQEVFEKLTQAGHLSPEILLNLAFAHFGQGRFKVAADVVGPLRDGPVQRLAWPLWLRCLHRLYRLEEALGELTAHPAPESLSPSAWGAASLIALDANRLVEAKTWALRAVKEEPRQQEALVTAGSLALGDRDAEGALACFQAALDVQVEDGRSWSGMGFARMLGQDLVGAQAAFQQAVSRMPDHIGTWIGFGWCRYLAGQLASAREAFERALSLDPNFGESHGALAVVQAASGDRTEATRSIERALRLDPKGLSARFAQALLSGEAQNPKAFLAFSRHYLAQHALPNGQGETLAGLLRHVEPRPDERP